MFGWARNNRIAAILEIRITVMHPNINDILTSHFYSEKHRGME
jgi:hypothetical protein